MNERRLLPIFCGPRCGSNLIVDLLSGPPDMITLTEVLSPVTVFGLNNHPGIAARLTKDAGGQDALHHLFRMEPIRAISTLDEAVPPDRVLVIKILHDHAHIRALEAILRKHAIGAIILTRRRIDQYVSLMTAEQTGKFTVDDTSDVRPNGDAERFLGWAGSLDDWLTRCARACDRSGVRWTQSVYEDDLETPDAAERAERVAAKLHALHLPAKPEDILKKTYLKRQNRTERGFDKFRNGDAMRAEIDTLGMLDYALGRIDLSSA